MKIRLVTFNTWHGLDHRHPYIMLPLQRPDHTLKRYQNQKRAIERLFKIKTEGLDVCCLQELNPLWPRLRGFKRALKAKGKGIIANAGIRAGYVGLPLFLDEGIATLFRGELKNALWSARTLSGAAKEFKLPLGVSFFMQLGERRVSLKLRGELGGVRVVVVQAHLHAGPGEGASSDRRTTEIERLADWIGSDLQKCDLLILAGDFNNDPDSKELASLHALGLESVSREVTWCPDENPLCKLPAGGARSDAEVEWDSKAHSFDRIYVWRNPKVIDEGSWRCKIQRVLDDQATHSLSHDLATHLSDHYGLMAEFSFQTLEGFHDGQP
jgi:endonuclease/exonuclease/phosphatase family metal-dependent hydrolase